MGGELQKVRELLKQATEWQEDTSDPAEFMSLVKESLYHAEVFVFTPKGDVKHLPRGSTALDFAYAVHTEVGNHCVGAKVNGKLVSTKHVLESGDTVEIVTSSSARPSEDWLKVLKSSEARGKVRHWLRLVSQDDSVALGREILEKELRKNRVAAPDDLTDVAVAMGFKSEEQLAAAIGRGETSVESVLLRISPRPPRGGIESVFPFKRLREFAERRRHYVKIQGISNLMVSFAHCCEPIPGDKITGIITRGRGVSVHRVDCPNTHDDRVEKGRRIDVEWDVGKEDLFMVNLIVRGSDRQNLLFDIAKAISETRTNIKRTDMGLVNGEVRGRFVVEVQNLRHLEGVIKAISKVKNVTGVERGQFLVEAFPKLEPEKDAER